MRHIDLSIQNINIWTKLWVSYIWSFASSKLIIIRSFFYWPKKYSSHYSTPQSEAHSSLCFSFPLHLPRHPPPYLSPGLVKAATLLGIKRWTPPVVAIAVGGEAHLPDGRGASGRITWPVGRQRRSCWGLIIMESFALMFSVCEMIWGLYYFVLISNFAVAAHIIYALRAKEVKWILFFNYF